MKKILAIKGILSLFFFVGAMLPLQAQFAQPVKTVKLPYGHQRYSLDLTADGVIKRAKADCYCTETRIEGEKLFLIVDTTEFFQDCSKSVFVVMEDGREAHVQMNFIVPQALEMSAKSLLWKKGGDAVAQTIDLKIPAGSPVEALEEAGVTGKNFEYETETLEKGRHYRITVRPRGTGEQCLERLVIKTRSRDVRSSQFIIYLRVSGV